MKSFLKFNYMSVFYAFILFIELQSILNFYRIVRITNWSFNAVKISITIFNLIVFLISTVIFFFIMRKTFKLERFRYLLTILWIPYFLVFTLINNFLFPIVVPGDKPVPVLGLLVIGAFLIYPFYIAFINAISSTKFSNKE